MDSDIIHAQRSILLRGELTDPSSMSHPIWLFLSSSMRKKKNLYDVHESRVIICCGAAIYWYVIWITPPLLMALLLRPPAATPCVKGRRHRFYRFPYHGYVIAEGNLATAATIKTVV